jgi:periplasmic protein TonB
MDFAQQQRNPAKHMVAIAIVLLLHLGVIYALVTGLARKVIEVIQHPVEVSIVAEIKPPPRKVVLPPPTRVVPPPAYVPPPPAYVPPPEVQVAAPPPQTNTIAAVTTINPAALAALPRRGVRPLNPDACRPQYPRRALREGQTGRGEALLDVAADGGVKSVVITLANPSGVFDKEVIRAMSRPECRFETSDTPYRVAWPWSFTLKDE